MTFEELTPDLRNEIQIYFLRRWIGKLRRVRFAKSLEKIKKIYKSKQVLEETRNKLRLIYRDRPGLF